MNEKALLFEKLRGGAKINIIGDSIAAGVGCSGGKPTEELLLEFDGDRYTRWIAPNAWWVDLKNYIAEKFPDCTVENHGCSGIYSYQLVGGLDQVISGDEDIVLILVGANDRKRKDGRRELEEGLRYMIDLFRSRGAIPVVISPNPSTAQNEMNPSRLCHIEDIVNVISYVCAEKDAIYADCYGMIMDLMAQRDVSIEELMSEEGCMSDGLHPTDRVQKFMAQFVLKTLGLSLKIPSAKW